MEKDFLETARRNLAILENTESSEQDVKRLVVEPVMLWAGIDVYDPSSLREEFTIKQVKSATKVDYAVLVDGSPKIAVEAKNLKERLDDKLKQLIDYCNYGNIRFGLITNGKDWYFVDENWRDSKNNRVFLKIKLNSEYVELIKLMNPLLLDILENFAYDYERIQIYDFKDANTLKNSLRNKTIKKIRERVDKKYSESEISESLPEEKSDGKFVSFSEVLKYKDVKGIKPPKIVIVNNEEIKVKHWKDVFVEFVKSSYKKLEIPFKTRNSNIRYLIGYQKTFSDGKEMVQPREINDNGQILYFETDHSIKSIFGIIKRIKEIANLPDDYVKFPSDWFEEIKKYVEEKKNKNVRS